MSVLSTSVGQNVAPVERWLTVLAGVGALALAARVPGARVPLSAVSGALLVRGATGYCPAYAAAGRRARTDTREALGGPRGSHLRAAITIAQPPETVFAFWRNLDHLSQALPAGITIEQIDDRRSPWTLTPTSGSAPTTASWVAEIINEEPARLIGWRTTHDADVVSAGSVRFVEAPGRQGTEVHVHMQYSPPFGKVGARLARVFGRGADQVVTQSLRDIKRYLELGRHVTLTDGSSR